VDASNRINVCESLIDTLLRMKIPKPAEIEIKGIVYNDGQQLVRKIVASYNKNA
jgi:hypothetical protein